MSIFRVVKRSNIDRQARQIEGEQLESGEKLTNMGRRRLREEARWRWRREDARWWRRGGDRGAGAREETGGLTGN
jgi:hypothetical protein